jgi:ferritin-like metal-binding protein YciE
MARQIKMGANRTGIATSPIDSRLTIEGAERSAPGAGDRKAILKVLAEMSRSSEPVGHIPLPGSLSGLAATGMEKMMGNQTEIFIDHLGERLAFERTGTRIYDAFLAKCEGEKAPGNMSMGLVRQFRDQEAEHFRLIKKCIEHLGGDPTAVTPCADVAAVESMGLVQVINDPRITVDQSLHAILAAELTDQAGWQLLIRLARQLGKQEMAQQFERALSQEDTHLEHVRRWYEEVITAQAAGQQPSS